MHVLMNLSHRVGEPATPRPQGTSAAMGLSLERLLSLPDVDRRVSAVDEERLCSHWERSFITWLDEAS